MVDISVIVPVYKVEAYLHRCVDSILDQTFTNFELILVDDGSPDNCPSICDEYAQIDSRIHVIHQENGGLSAARNAGIDWVLEKSTSEWLTFIDSDDWIHPQCLEFLYRSVTENHTLLGVGGLMRVDASIPMDWINFTSHVEKSENLYLTFAHKIVNVSAASKIYNKKCFETIRYPLDKQWEDLATTYKLIMSVPECSVVESTLYYYFNNPEGIVRRSWTPKRLDEFEAYETQLEFFAHRNEWHEILEALQWTYIKAISYSYFMIRDSALPIQDKRYYGALLGRKMRNAIKKYKHSIPFSQNIAIYETAYPRLLNYYWHFRGILNKFYNR